MRAILLVDHGSRQARANEQLEEFAALVRSQTDALVASAHMELAEPTMERAIEMLLERGATELVVMPYFLAPGRHAMSDIPRLASEALANYPQVRWSVAAPLGVHDLLAKLVLLRVEEARSGAE